MLIWIPFHKKDAWLVRKSLAWMKELGGCAGHQCMLAVDQNAKGEEEYKLAQQVFDKVGAEVVQCPSTEWPQSANFMWQHCAFYMETKFKKGNMPWFFLEPDCIPLKPRWLDRIEEEYKKCGKPFLITSMGTSPHHNLCGNAVYPNNVSHYSIPALTTVTEPWDAFIRDLKSFTAFTDLIHHDYGNEYGKFEGQPLSFKSRSAMQKIMDSPAVVVHRCKDGSCIDVLSSKVEEKSFGHSGDLGDIIYCLYIMKIMGGGILYLKSDNKCREPMTEKRFNVLRPLLLSQSYIKEVKWWKEEIVTFDFTDFRREHKPDCSLLESQRKYIGAPAINPEFPWMSIKGNDNGKIVINRTERYNNPTFPWHKLVEKYGKHMVFLGLPEEHMKFCSEHGPILYQPTQNLLEAAEWIAGSHCFIGNQSSLYAVAEGIKHRRICEVSPHAWSQNVFLGGGLVQYALSGSIDESWLQSVVSGPKTNGKLASELITSPMIMKSKRYKEMKKRGRPKKIVAPEKLGVEALIIADKKAGMSWRQLMAKYKLNAVKLKQVLS